MGMQMMLRRGDQEALATFARSSINLQIDFFISARDGLLNIDKNWSAIHHILTRYGGSESLPQGFLFCGEPSATRKALDTAAANFEV